MYNCNYFPTTSTTSSSFQPTSSNNTHPNNSMMDSFSSMMLDDDSITSLSSNNNNNNNLMEDISCIIEYGANLFASSNLPLSPPTVIIPSGSSNNNSRHTTPANNHHHHNNNNSNVIVTPSGAGGSVGDFAAHMLFSDDFDQVERVETMLELDTRSVLREWEEFVDNNNINNNNNNHNYTINNNNTINHNIHHNNSSNNINNNNTNNISVNIQPSDEQDAQDLLNLINSNSNNNNTGLITQAYLGSVLANCTSIQGLPSNTIKRSIHQHSKSPSLGSLNNNHTTNGSSSNSSSRGIRKGGHQRSHSVQAACAQAITYTNSMMHKKNGQSVSAGFNNMNAGLGSPSVTSSNYSSVAVMSPANVSSNSFANQVMYNNGYNNQSFASAQCSPVLSNQPQVPTGSNKRGKVPLHRQDKSQQANLMNQHSKGLLVDANPNDRPVKMQQSKICDSGIKIQIEDGINKNKKDTGLQFHTCTFK